MRCARPGCDGAAEATLGYDARQRTAWLVPGIVDGALPLCALHADGLAVPRGWALDDRRRPEPPVAEPAPEPPVAEPALEPAVADAADPADAAARWEPRFDSTGDLDGLLAARTPLLARAFGGNAGTSGTGLPAPAPTPRRRRPPRRPSAEPDA